MPFVKGVLARRPDDLEAAAKLLFEFGFDPVDLETPKLSYEPRWSCQCKRGCAALWIASKSGDVMRIDLRTDDPTRPPRQTWFPGNRAARSIHHQHAGAALRAPRTAASSVTESVLLIGRDDGYLDIIPDDHEDWTSQAPSQYRAGGFGSFHLDSWWWHLEHAPPDLRRDEIAVSAGFERAEHDSARYAMGITAIAVLEREDRSGTLDILVATRHPWLYLLEAEAGQLRLRSRIQLPGWIEWIIEPRHDEAPVICISRGGDLVRLSRRDLQDGRAGTAQTVSRLPTAALPLDDGVLLGTTTGLFLVCDNHPDGIAVPVTRSPVLCLDRIALDRGAGGTRDYIVMGLEDGRLRIVDAVLLSDLTSGRRVVDEPAAESATLQPTTDGTGPRKAEDRPNFAIQMDHAVLAVETLQAGDTHEAYVLAVLRDHSVCLYHTTSPDTLRARIAALWKRHVASLPVRATADGAPITDYQHELDAAGGAPISDDKADEAARSPRSDAGKPAAAGPSALAPAWSDGGKSALWRSMLVEVVLPRLLEIAPHDRDAQRDVVALACKLADAADRHVLHGLTAAMGPLTRGQVTPVDLILELSRHILRAVPHRDERGWLAFIERHLRELHTLTRQIRSSQDRDRERMVAWSRFVRKYVLLGNTFDKKIELLDLIEMCYEAEKYLDALIYQASLSQRCYDLRWDLAAAGEVNAVHVVPCGDLGPLVVVVMAEGKLVFHDGDTGRHLEIEQLVEVAEPGRRDRRPELAAVERVEALVPFGEGRAITACAVVGSGERFWIAASCAEAAVAPPGISIWRLARPANRPGVVQAAASGREVRCVDARARVYALQVLPDGADPREGEPPSFVAGLESPTTPVGLVRCVAGAWTLELASDESGHATARDGSRGISERTTTRALAVAAFDDQATRYLLVAGSDDGLVRAATFYPQDAVRDWQVRPWDRLSDPITGVVLGRHRRTGLVPDADESLFSCYVTTRGGDVVALAILDYAPPADDPAASSLAGHDAQPLWRDTLEGPVMAIGLWRTPLYQADEVLVVVTEKGRLCLYNHSPSTGKERVSVTSNYYFRGMRFDRVTLTDRPHALTMIENSDRFVAAGPGRRLYAAQLVYLRDSVLRKDPDSELPPPGIEDDLRALDREAGRNGLPSEMWERMNHLFVKMHQAEMFESTLHTATPDRIESTRIDLLDLVRLGGSALQRYALQRRLKSLQPGDDRTEAELRDRARELLEPLDPEVPQDAETIKVVFKSLCFARLYRNPRELRNEIVKTPSAQPSRYEGAATVCEVVADQVARKLRHATSAAARLRIVAIKELMRVPMLRYLALDTPEDPRILRAVTSLLAGCLRDENHMVRNEALRATSNMLRNVVVMADAVADEQSDREAAQPGAGRRARDGFLAALFRDGLGSLAWLIDLLIDGLRRVTSFTRRTALASAAWYHIAALVPLFRLFPERTLALSDYLMRAGLSIEVLALVHQSLRRRGPTRIRSRIKQLYLIPALESEDAQTAFITRYKATGQEHEALRTAMHLKPGAPGADPPALGSARWWQIDDAAMADRLLELLHRMARMWSVQRHAQIDESITEFQPITRRPGDPLGAIEFAVAELAEVAGELRNPKVLKARALDKLEYMGRRWASSAESTGGLTARLRTILSGIVVSWRRAYTPRKGTMLGTTRLGDPVDSDSDDLATVFDVDSPAGWKDKFVVRVLQRSNATDLVRRFVDGAQFQQQLRRVPESMRHIVEIREIYHGPQYAPHLAYVTPKHPSLRSVLREGLPRIDDAVTWADQAARQLGLALQAVHRSKRWHGYVRPRSIFVSEDAGARVFLLGDLHLAFGHDTESERPIGVVPDCLWKRSRDAAALLQRQWEDVAALSLVLYEMLTGASVDPRKTQTLDEPVRRLWKLQVASKAAQASPVIELLQQIFADDSTLTIDQLLRRLEALDPLGDRPRKPPPADRGHSASPPREDPGDQKDLAVLTASTDEFEQLASIVELDKPAHESADVSPFQAPGAQGAYRGIATCAVDTGAPLLHDPAYRTLERWQPAVAVTLGVGTSLDKDIARLGDIIVELGGGASADDRLLDAVMSAHRRHRKEFAEFADTCAADCDTLVVPQRRVGLERSGLLSRPVAIHRYHRASGPTVADAPELVSGPGDQDLGFQLLEAGAGPARSAVERPAIPVLAVIGIADIQGPRFDRDGLRRYATRNAVRFLLLLARLGILPRHAVTAVAARRTEEMPVTGGELLTRLARLLQVQFDEVVFRANIPPGYVPGAGAPQTARAIAMLEYMVQQQRLQELARIIDLVLNPR